ncbi:TPA: hypothetical protein ACW72U_005111 [Enterobacter ludwigii]|jgi:hypothetical protein|uniref:hypothetical protein n=1 Tax=Enterobacter TaxID=547 RepID=UPI000FD8B4A1|nr:MULTISPECIES: hypothetical protein [Enterobacter]EKS7109479.1 hypothetical protein [Enterobacter ludwigii]ELQ7821086.1 hypothetical protein [Enterobacter ludwigii]MBA7771676.1 hypothetical protein [Enterobacter sp. RHBSTW-00974]MBA7774851.1 hypothetical protein [Enterobacter sp. RHBSTW-00318]MBA7828316.1 hypothetical protein [Enterobacter sp. RHBSTW-00340]
MSSIRELSFFEVAQVSGGGNAGDHDRSSSSNSGSKNSGSKNSNIYNGVDSCGAGIIGGLVAGSPGGPLGMAAGVIGGAIAGQCTKDSFSSKADCKGSNQKSSDFTGQCRW